MGLRTKITKVLSALSKHAIHQDLAKSLRQLLFNWKKSTGSVWNKFTSRYRRYRSYRVLYYRSSDSQRSYDAFNSCNALPELRSNFRGGSLKNVSRLRRSEDWRYACLTSVLNTLKLWIILRARVRRLDNVCSVWLDCTLSTFSLSRGLFMKNRALYHSEPS